MSLPKGSIKKPMSSGEIMKTPFLMFQSHRDDYYNMSQDSVRGVQEESILSKVFFHPKNVDLIQKQIILEVFRRTDGAYWIEKQNEIDLQIIMRSMFIQHARHVPGYPNGPACSLENKADHIKEQIQELNNLVVDDVVPGIVTQILQYFGYIRDAFNQPVPIARPVNMSSAGTKTIPSVTRRFDSS